MAELDKRFYRGTDDYSDGDEQKKKREKQDRLEAAVYALRQKKGGDAITLGFQRNDVIGIHRKT